MGATEIANVLAGWQLFMAIVTFIVTVWIAVAARRIATREDAYQVETYCEILGREYRHMIAFRETAEKVCQHMREYIEKEDVQETRKVLIELFTKMTRTPVQSAREAMNKYEPAFVKHRDETLRLGEVDVKMKDLQTACGQVCARIEACARFQDELLHRRFTEEILQTEQNDLGPHDNHVLKNRNGRIDPLELLASETAGIRWGQLKFIMEEYEKDFEDWITRCNDIESILNESQIGESVVLRSFFANLVSPNDIPREGDDEENIRLSNEIHLEAPRNDEKIAS